MQALVNSTGDKQEAEFLTYLVGPKPLLKALVVYKSLSIHPDDEITLEALNPLFTVRAAWLEWSLSSGGLHGIRKIWTLVGPGTLSSLACKFVL